MKNFLTGNGFILVPRVTTTERNALTAANAMLVYDTTLNKFYFYENGAWINVGGGSWGSITGTLSSQTDLQNALNAKENTITAGTTAQYFRGDKTFQTLDKTAVGLSNVDNTSDANKSISTATQTALDAKTFSVPFLSNALDPLDATNYFFGGISNLIPPSTTNTNQDFVIGYACTVVGCVIQAHGNTTQGSSEDVALSLRNNTANTTTSMGNFKTNATSTTTVVTAITGLNISVVASELICLQMNGTWATNPQGLRLTGYLIIRL